MSDSFNTAVVVTTTLQNQVQKYDLLTLTYLTMVEWVGQGLGIYCYWFIQRKFSLSTKTMFNTVAIFSIIMDIWGLVGIWTQTIGFHQPWEFWLFQAWLGFFVSPYYSYSQIMVTSLPRIPASPTNTPSSDFRSNSPRQRIPLLLLLQHCRHDDLIHWPRRLQRHHRCLAERKRLFALLFSNGYERH